MSVRSAVIHAAGLLPGPRIGRLCIFTSGRTGSELLVDLLDSHPRMRCEGEILRNPQGDAVRFVRGRVRVAAFRGNEAYGFKFITGQTWSLGRRMELRNFAEALSTDGFRHVRLRRRNLLRQALSQLRAGQTRRFHVRTDVAASALPIDPVQLIYTMCSMELNDMYLDRQLEGRDPVELVYEDHLESEAARGPALARLFELAGLDPLPPSTDLRKQTPASLTDAIANYDEVATALRATRYARYLDD